VKGEAMNALRLMAIVGMCVMGFRGSRLVAEEDDGDWEPWPVPGVRAAGDEGVAWCRAFVRVPDAWGQPQGLSAESVTLTLDHVVDACTAYVNGVQVGQCGAFPPAFQSARDEANRFKIPAGTLRAGQYNAIVLKLFGQQGRVGFQGRAPVLAGYHDECVMAGAWEFRPGSEPPASLAARLDKPALAAFDRFTFATSTMGRPRELNPGQHLPPDAALAAMHAADDLAVDLVLSEPDIAQPLSLDFDERGRLWVVEYRQYPFPAGLTMVSRDKFYRATYDRVPTAPPHHAPGADRITIHQDTDGDGRFDRHQVFVEGLSIVSSMEPGDGGVWVLNPPYLLFYADADGDDRPDGDPQVHLEGFGLEDTHSVANSLTWGPDGWLYGAQGSTTSSRITVHGTNQPAVYRDGAMIWRYHPRSRRYEVFAEGGGNAFGLEIDAQGRVYSGHNGNNTRGFYYVPDGYFQKGTEDKYGPLSNPHAYGHLMYMDHGAVPRFSHDLVKYEEAGLPARYQGRLFSIDPLQQQVIEVAIEPFGATFRTRDQGVALATKDSAFRPVDVTVGPDGAVYVADLCEQFIAHGQHFQGQVDPSTGRVYRLRSARAADHVRLNDVNLAAQSTAQLVEQLRSPRRWVRRTALRLLGQRRDAAAVAELRRMLDDSVDQPALEALWALNLLDSLARDDLHLALRHSNPHVRRWMVRLWGERPRGADDGAADDRADAELATLARQEADAEVRAQLACTAKRLPTAAALPVIAALLTHDADVSDPYIPLLIWWALESKANDHAAVVELWHDPSIWQRPIAQQTLLARLMRRYAGGDRAELMVCAELLELAPDDAARAKLLEGFEQAFAGRSAGELPERLARALEAAGGGSLALRMRRGDRQAIDEALAALASQQTDVGARIEYARLLAETKQPAALDVLLAILQQADAAELLRVVLSAVGTYDDPRVARVVGERLTAWPVDLRQDAYRLLSSRADWARQLVQTIDAHRSLAAEVPIDAAVRLTLLDDSSLSQQARSLWPALDGDLAAANPATLQRVMSALEHGEPDPYRGRALFTEHCAKCHQLFRQGGQIGPNLTSYQRQDTSRMALQIVNPSLEIREGFEMWMAVTADGRAINGFLLDQDTNVVVLRGADGQNVILPRNQLDELQRSRLSLMPAGLLDPLDDQQIRDLFAFLRLSQPLNEPL
jgi:putative membrane-bound dehydrogenase-like protein